MPKQN